MRFRLLSMALMILGLSIVLLVQGANVSTQELPSISPDAGCGADPSTLPSLNLLVFSKTTGYRHDSIPDGVAALESLASLRNWRITATEDAAIFTDGSLHDFNAVIFLNTTGDILNAEQEATFERYIQRGGGFVGIHAASDTEYDWAWYGGLIGAYFADHPAGILEANVLIEDATHPAAQTLPEVWTRHDEWYNFKSNPREDLHVILSLDESTYSGGTMQGDHPIAWSHEYDGGRAFYTGLGHTSESFSDALFLEHLIGGIEWTGGRCPAHPPEATAEAAQEPD